MEVIPNRGASVNFITLKELKNIIQLLQILEGGTLELAFETLDRERLKALEKTFVTLRRQGLEVSNEETARQGVPLHGLIFEASGNEKLSETASRLREKIRTLSRTAVQGIPGRARESVNEHLRIIRAIDRGDPTAAKTAISEHLANMYKVMTKLID